MEEIIQPLLWKSEGQAIHVDFYSNNGELVSENLLVGFMQNAKFVP